MKRAAKGARAFPGPAAFRAWLEEHNATAAELFVRCCKSHVAHEGLTYRQALDEALCFGWIDGVRHSLDESSFSVRFTPRKPKSAWSAINIKRAGQLRAEGRMHAAGLEAFAGRAAMPGPGPAKRRPLSPSFLRKLRANARAWRFFAARPPGYRRLCASWVMSAKRPETRVKRLEVLIASSEHERPIPPLRRPGGQGAA